MQTRNFQILNNLICFNVQIFDFAVLLIPFNLIDSGFYQWSGFNFSL